MTPPISASRRRVLQGLAAVGFTTGEGDGRVAADIDYGGQDLRDIASITFTDGTTQTTAASGGSGSTTTTTDSLFTIIDRDLRLSLEGLHDSTYAIVLPGTYPVEHTISISNQSDVTVEFFPGATVDMTEDKFVFQWTDCSNWVLDGVTLTASNNADVGATAFDWHSGNERMELRDFDVLNYPGICTQIRGVDHLRIEHGYYQPRKHSGFINIRDGRHVHIQDLTGEAAGQRADAGIDIKAQNRDVYDINVSDVSLDWFNSGLGFGTEIAYDVYDVTVDNLRVNRTAVPLWFKAQEGGDVYDFDIDVRARDTDGEAMLNLVKLQNANGGEIRDGYCKVRGRGTMAGSGIQAVPVSFYTGTIRGVDFDLKWQTGAGAGTTPPRYFDVYSNAPTIEDVAFDRLHLTGGCANDGIILRSGTVEFDVRDLMVNGHGGNWLTDQTGWVGEITGGDVSGGVDVTRGTSIHAEQVTGMEPRAYRLIVNGHTIRGLNGSAPDATRFRTGDVVEDYHNPGTLWFIYDDSTAGGATKIA